MASSLHRFHKRLIGNGKWSRREEGGGEGERREDEGGRKGEARGGRRMEEESGNLDHGLTNVQWTIVIRVEYYFLPVTGRF